MIGEYTLKMLCQKYELNSEELVNKNNNILKYGEYIDIDKTLNYLINELEISATNIEKCPSVLYRNIEYIKYNYEFIINKELNYSNVESCLHILSSIPNELVKTYKYIEKNYGKNIINKLTSILSVPTSIIKDVEDLNLPFSNKNDNLSIAVSIEWGMTNLEEIQKIINSDEFEKYPELFTSTTLVHATLEEIQKIINSDEFKKYPELFTSETLAHATLEEIQKIISSDEFEKYPELFTSTTLAHATLEEIQKIINSDEFKKYPELFTSQTLAHATLEEIQKIINSDEFEKYPELFTSTTLAHATLEEIQKIINSDEFEKYPELFTSQTLAHATLEEIQKLLNMDCWNDSRFKPLLTSSIVAKSKSMKKKLPILIMMAEENNIDKYLNTSFLLFSPSQNYALIEYVKDNNIPLVIDDKLNPIFGKQPGVLKKKYGIDMNEIMEKYKYENREEVSNRGGVRR